RDNGRLVAEIAGGALDFPHFHAVRGACKKLQEAHVPFGVVTRRQLDKLERYRVVVLPNVLRLDDDELEALRAYVAAGGTLYASRYTSLTETRGVRRDDFGLADVFGCSFAADDLAGSVASARRFHVLPMPS